MYYAIGASVSSLHRESTDSPILGSYRLLTLGAHAQEGYGTCPVCLFVCLCVCYHLIADMVRFYCLPKARAALC